MQAKRYTSNLTQSEYETIKQFLPGQKTNKLKYQWINLLNAIFYVEKNDSKGAKSNISTQYLIAFLFPLDYEVNTLSFAFPNISSSLNCLIWDKSSFSESGLPSSLKLYFPRKLMGAQR